MTYVLGKKFFWMLKLVPVPQTMLIELIVR